MECVTAIGVDRVIKTERTLDGIEGENDVLFRNAGFGGNFVESRLFVSVFESISLVWIAL